jgi:hypothetical protein
VQLKKRHQIAKSSHLSPREEAFYLLHRRLRDFQSHYGYLSTIQGLSSDSFLWELANEKLCHKATP